MFRLNFKADLKLWNITSLPKTNFKLLLICMYTCILSFCVMRHHLETAFSVDLVS